VPLLLLLLLLALLLLVAVGLPRRACDHPYRREQERNSKKVSDTSNHKASLSA
jgi:hypothetical protein